MQAAIAGNLAFAAAWTWSHTAGLPAWTGDKGVDEAAAVDIFCVALELGVVVVGIALLLRPSLLESWERSALVTASVAGVAVLVATTAVLAAPSTANHGHDDGGGHEHLEAAGGGTPASDEHHEHEATGEHETGHQHSESDIGLDQLPPTTKAEVDQVIDLWADKYPTAADATNAGWMKATPSLHGIGAHFIRDVNGFSVAEPFDMLNPNILLYDGEGPDARFAGVSYVVAGDVEGFTGDYDFWHGHSSVCMAAGGITLTEEESDHWYSESECTSSGGRLMPLPPTR